MSSGKALEAIGHKNDPYNYNEAMGDVNANLQKKAMNVEMDSMGSNKVCELIELPEGIKLTGCK